MGISELIRDRLRTEIDRKGLSAVDVARMASVKNSFIYDILNGKSTNPSAIKLAQVAAALEIDLAYLTREDAPSPSPSYIVVPRVTAVAGKVVAEAGKSYFFRRDWIHSLGIPAEVLSIVQINDDAMEPTLRSGDIALVNTKETSPTRAGLFLLFDQKSLSIRRISLSGPDTLHIMSDNPKYGNFDKAVGIVDVIGRVVWFGCTV